MRNSIFKTVFRGRDKSISIFVWFKMLFIELYMGEHLLEMLSSTASYNHESVASRFDSETNGWRRPLEDFIPATLFTRLLRVHILELLEKKYIAHYSIMQKVELKEDEKELDTGATRYELNHGNLHLLTELRISYNTAWVILNISIDAIVFLITLDWVMTLISGAVVEIIRRFKL